MEGRENRVVSSSCLSFHIESGIEERIPRDEKSDILLIHPIPFDEGESLLLGGIIDPEIMKKLAGFNLFVNRNGVVGVESDGIMDDTSGQ